LGQTARAIELHERELVIANEIGDSSGKLHAIAHLAHCYANQGDDVTAMDFQKQAIAMAQEIRHRSGEGYEFASLADLLSQRGFYQAAIDQALAAVKINEELQSPRLGSYSGGSLARAHLLAGALSEARAAAEAARLCDAPENNYYVRALGGVIALRQGDRAAAAQMLAAAMTDASRILEENSYNYEALDSKALALCGLALCGETGRAADAMDSYRAARKINGDAGVVKRVLQLFDALAVLDTGGVLARVRATAAGEG
jgi:tetratricopeptide (TPR) repeat protein